MWQYGARGSAYRSSPASSIGPGRGRAAARTRRRGCRSRSGRHRARHGEEGGVAPGAARRRPVSTTWCPSPTKAEEGVVEPGHVAVVRHAHQRPAARPSRSPPRPRRATAPSRHPARQDQTARGDPPASRTSSARGAPPSYDAQPVRSAGRQVDGGWRRLLLGGRVPGAARRAGARRSGCPPSARRSPPSAWRSRGSAPVRRSPPSAAASAGPDGWTLRHGRGRTRRPPAPANRTLTRTPGTAASAIVSGTR